ncbi:MAG: transcription antitermination protein NusB [Saprospiraceae bacterium]|nr:transcription antitermination protein NusB [Saprospiraceae bacterium]
MLSRRSVRIKVIQLLYSVSRDEDITRDELIKRYWKSIDSSFELFLYNIYTLLQIASIAEEDKDKRATKYLQSEVDKSFDAKIYFNPRIKDLEKNKNIQKVFDKYHFKERTDKDIFRKIYYDFQKEEPYQQYISRPTNDDDDLEMLLELFRFCRQSADYNELIEDHYVTWEDDKSLVIGSIKKVLKGLPFEKDDFYKEYYPEEECIKDFGEFLLLRTFEEDKSLLNYISPVLKNWHHDRVAVIDMIMLKMAIIEFMYCDSIPVKVTLNEYVELSKVYSTSKSKEFINGVLDRLQHQLTEEGKIVKSGRGLED